MADVLSLVVSYTLLPMCMYNNVLSAGGRSNNTIYRHLAVFLRSLSVEFDTHPSWQRRTTPRNGGIQRRHTNRSCNTAHTASEGYRPTLTSSA